MAVCDRFFIYICIIVGATGEAVRRDGSFLLLTLNRLKR